MTAPALQVVDVVKRYGSGPTEVRALNGVSLTVTPSEFVAVMGPENDPIVAARSTLRSGHLPRGPGKVAVSPQLARAWDLHVGSRLDLAQLNLNATVVGIAHRLTGAREDTLYVGQVPDISLAQRSRSLFIDLPGDASAVAAALGAINATGLQVPAQYAGARYGPMTQGGTSDRDAEVRWSTVVGALALAVLGIVIAAAFAVGARRQLRALGILASSGASPAALRAVVLWQGAWSGLLGRASGLALGVLGLAALWPHHDRFLSYEPAWFTVRPADLAPIAVLGVITALAASSLPARSVSRLTILTALGGCNCARRRCRKACGVLGAHLSGVLGAVLLGSLARWPSDWTTSASSSRTSQRRSSSFVNSASSWKAEPWSRASGQGASLDWATNASRSP